MEYILVTTMVVGVVELLRRIKLSDWFAVVTIIVAALIGGISGFFGVEGLTVASGIVAGLAGSGLVTIATRVG